MARRRPKKPRTPFYLINHNIRAQEVRVVDEKGKQVGVMPLGKALSQAHKKGLDLVEVAPKAQPPVCKIINFKKFKFLEAKKRKAERKKTKKVEIKQIRFRPFIAENDFNFRLNKAEEFLKEGDKVKLVVHFRGREMTKKEFGYGLLKKATERLRPFSKVEIEPKFVGRRLEMAFAPIKNVQAKTKNQKVSQKKV